MPSAFSHSRRDSSSLVVVPYRRLSTRGSPSKGPVIMHTARNFFPTSIPAHRSTAAWIISALLPGGRTADIFRTIFFLGSTAPFGDSTCQPGQFRLRFNPSITHSGRLLPLAPISHIFMAGDERIPVMRVSFRNFRLGSVSRHGDPDG